MSDSPAAAGHRRDEGDDEHDEQVGPSDSTSAVASQRIDSDPDHWTPERMKSAKPMDLERDRPGQQEQHED